MEEELKQMMLTKTKEMYNRAINGYIGDFVNNQRQLQLYDHGRAGGTCGLLSVQEIMTIVKIQSVKKTIPKI
jgi:hypothetical protein